LRLKRQAKNAKLAPNTGPFLFAAPTGPACSGYKIRKTDAPTDGISSAVAQNAVPLLRIPRSDSLLH
jgi:hypothetical protein